MEKYQVREATKEDCKDLFRLISKLADFEYGKTDISVEILEHDGFELENPRFHAFVATHDNDVIGFALTYRNYSTWKGCCVYLEDLYVETEHRGSGVGTSLLKAVTKYALDVGSERLDWVCIDFNVRAQQFYESIGAKRLSDWFLYRMTKEQMENFLTNYKS